MRRGPGEIAYWAGSIHAAMRARVSKVSRRLGYLTLYFLYRRRPPPARQGELGRAFRFSYGGIGGGEEGRGEWAASGPNGGGSLYNAREIVARALALASVAVRASVAAGRAHSCAAHATHMESRAGWAGDGRTATTRSMPRAEAAGRTSRRGATRPRPPS